MRMDEQILRLEVGSSYPLHSILDKLTAMGN